MPEEVECKTISRPTSECQLYMVLQIDTVKDLINKNHSLLDKKLELMLQSQNSQQKLYEELATHVYGNGKMGLPQLKSEWEEHKDSHKSLSNKGFKIFCILFQIIMVLSVGAIAKKVFTTPYHQHEEQTTEEIQHSDIIQTAQND